MCFKSLSLLFNFFTFFSTIDSFVLFQALDPRMDVIPEGMVQFEKFLTLSMLETAEIRWVTFECKVGENGEVDML